MNSWVSENLIGLLGIIVGGFIAYHVYFLTKRLGFSDRLVHKDKIRGYLEPLLQEMNTQRRNRKVELVNVKKYFSHYPHTNDETRQGYTYLGAELKAIKFDGIEFFAGVKELYVLPNGTFSLKNQRESDRAAFNVFEVGVIPYQWIDYVDIHGDEFSYRAQFFTKFKGLQKMPYKYLVYYIENKNYHSADPFELKYKRIDLV